MNKYDTDDYMGAGFLLLTAIMLSILLSSLLFESRTWTVYGTIMNSSCTETDCKIALLDGDEYTLRSSLSSKLESGDVCKFIVTRDHVFATSIVAAAVCTENVKVLQ